MSCRRLLSLTRPSRNLSRFRTKANAVLAAVESVISSKGLSPSPISYFGALMFTLDEDPDASQQIIGAVFYLLSLVMPE